MRGSVGISAVSCLGVIGTIVLLSVMKQVVGSEGEDEKECFPESLLPVHACFDFCFDLATCVSRGVSLSSSQLVLLLSSELKERVNILNMNNRQVGSKKMFKLRPIGVTNRYDRSN